MYPRTDSYEFVTNDVQTLDGSYVNQLPSSINPPYYHNGMQQGYGSKSRNQYPKPNHQHSNGVGSRDYGSSSNNQGKYLPEHGPDKLPGSLGNNQLRHGQGIYQPVSGGPRFSSHHEVTVQKYGSNKNPSINNQVKSGQNGTSTKTNTNNGIHNGFTQEMNGYDKTSQNNQMQGMNIFE